MKHSTTFQLKDTVVSFDGAKVTHVRGPQGMFVVAREEAELIREGMHPTISAGYLPDIVNGIPELLIKEYGGKMIRRAKAPKFDPDVVY